MPSPQPSSRGVLCCGFSLDGRLLACGGSDWAVRLYDVATGRERAALEGHRGDVNACAFNGPTPCSDTSWYLIFNSVYWGSCGVLKDHNTKGLYQGAGEILHRKTRLGKPTKNISNFIRKIFCLCNAHYKIILFFPKAVPNFFYYATSE